MNKIIAASLTLLAFSGCASLGDALSGFSPEIQKEYIDPAVAKFEKADNAYKGHQAGGKKLTGGQADEASSLASQCIEHLNDGSRKANFENRKFKTHRGTMTGDEIRQACSKLISDLHEVRNQYVANYVPDCAGSQIAYLVYVTQDNQRWISYWGTEKPLSQDLAFGEVECAKMPTKTQISGYWKQHEAVLRKACSGLTIVATDVSRKRHSDFQNQEYDQYSGATCYKRNKKK